MWRILTLTRDGGRAGGNAPERASLQLAYSEGWMETEALLKSLTLICRSVRSGE